MATRHRRERDAPFPAYGACAAHLPARPTWPVIRSLGAPTSGSRSSCFSPSFALLSLQWSDPRGLLAPMARGRRVCLETACAQPRRSIARGYCLRCIVSLACGPPRRTCLVWRASWGARGHGAVADLGTFALLDRRCHVQRTTWPEIRRSPARSAGHPRGHSHPRGRNGRMGLRPGSPPLASCSSLRPPRARSGALSRPPGSTLINRVRRGGPARARQHARASAQGIAVGAAHSCSSPRLSRARSCRAKRPLLGGALRRGRLWLPHLEHTSPARFAWPVRIRPS
jgi:hypothetical protein